MKKILISLSLVVLIVAGYFLFSGSGEINIVEYKNDGFTVSMPEDWSLYDDSFGISEPSFVFVYPALSEIEVAKYIIVAYDATELFLEEYELVDIPDALNKRSELESVLEMGHKLILASPLAMSVDSGQFEWLGEIDAGNEGVIIYATRASRPKIMEGPYPQPDEDLEGYTASIFLINGGKLMQLMTLGPADDFDKVDKAIDSLLKTINY
ncbi:MAG: hypothetical protein Q8O87_02225 [bacterium]|nr:hypothetical protein [bacterium]